MPGRVIAPARQPGPSSPAFDAIGVHREPGRVPDAPGRVFEILLVEFGLESERSGDLGVLGIETRRDHGFGQRRRVLGGRETALQFGIGCDLGDKGINCRLRHPGSSIW